MLAYVACLHCCSVFTGTLILNLSWIKMDTKTEMLIPRFCRTPGELHLGHSIFAPIPNPRGWHCPSIVLNVMSEWTHAPPKRPCSIKAKAPHCASLWRFVKCDFEFSNGCQCQEKHFMLCACECPQLTFEGCGSPSQWWCKSPSCPRSFSARGCTGLA